MMLRCKCPGCGTQTEYIAEQVGTMTDCRSCGRAFALQANRGRVAWHIIAATLGVLVLVGGVTHRFYKRAKRSEMWHNAAAQAHEQHRTEIGDDRDD
jgi:ribosomal protein S27E